MTVALRNSGVHKMNLKKTLASVIAMSFMICLEAWGVQKNGALVPKIGISLGVSVAINRDAARPPLPGLLAAPAAVMALDNKGILNPPPRLMEGEFLEFFQTLDEPLRRATNEGASVEDLAKSAGDLLRENASPAAVRAMPPISGGSQGMEFPGEIIMHDGAKIPVTFDREEDARRLPYFFSDDSKALAKLLLEGLKIQPEQIHLLRFNVHFKEEVKRLAGYHDHNVYSVEVHHWKGGDAPGTFTARHSLLMPGWFDMRDAVPAQEKGRVQDKVKFEAPPRVERTSPRFPGDDAYNKELNMIVGNKAQVLVAWDAKTGEELFSHSWHTFLGFTPKGELVEENYKRNSVMIYNPITEHEKRFLGQYDQKIDEDRIAISDGKKSYILNLITGKLLPVEGNKTPWGNSDRLLRWGPKNILLVVDVKTGQTLGKIRVDGQIEAVSPDLSRIAAVSKSNVLGILITEVTLYDGLPGGNFIASWSGRNQWPKFSPDGLSLIITSEDLSGVTQRSVYDARTGKPIE